MYEQQIVLSLKGKAENPLISRSARAGVSRFSGKSQRAHSLDPDKELLAAGETLLSELQNSLQPYLDETAEIEAKCLARDSWFGDGQGERQSYRGFWGRITLRDNLPAVFGSRPDGRLVFRRGPWEAWPTDLPQLAFMDPSVPIVLSPYCATLFHEAVGHALEAEYLATSPLKTMMGRSVAVRELTVSDRPSLQGYAGSMNYDDTGHAATDTTLIHRGVLVGDLDHGRGVHRRASFQDPPLIRATNFLLSPGKEAVTDWLASLDRCYFITDVQSGSWHPGSQSLKALTGPVFYLEKGVPTGYLPWATPRFTTLGLLHRIKALSGKLVMDPVVHWCLKRNQAVPMSMGSPSVLLEGERS